MDAPERIEVIHEINTAMLALGEVMKSGGPHSLDDICYLSGLLHFIGCKLGERLIATPDDTELADLLKQCCALQDWTMEQAEAMAYMTRAAQIEAAAATIH